MLGWIKSLWSRMRAPPPPFCGLGLPLGFDVDGELVAPALSRHAVVVAAAGSGKSRALATALQLYWSGSMVVIDPKAEHTVVCSGRRGSQGGRVTDTLGQDVFVLDPKGIVSGPAAAARTTFNFLDAIRAEHLISDCEAIAEAVVPPDPHAREPFFKNNARRLIAGLILHVKTRYATELQTLPHVRRLLTLGEQSPDDLMELEAWNRRNPDDRLTPMDALLDAMRTNPAADHYAAKSVAPVLDGGANSSRDILSTAREETAFLDNEDMIAVMQPGPLDIDAVLKRPTTVYLCLPMSDMAGSMSKWMRLFINVMLTRAEEVAAQIPAGQRQRCLFLLDEAFNLGHFPIVERAAAGLRAAGCFMFPFFQNLGQIKALYTKNFETFFSNADYRIFFGISDLETATHVSKLVGQHWVDRSSSNTSETFDVHTGLSKDHTQNRSTSTSPQLEQRFRPEDLMYDVLRQAGDRLMVFNPDGPPWILTKMLYDESIDRDLYDPHPDFVEESSE